MLPVNLIPPEDRRGETAPTRTGGLAHAVVAILGIALAAVIGVVFLDKSVADRAAEATRLEGQETALQARASSLSSFATFQQIRDARVATIDSLAKSRFDWERVMRELAIVIPAHVWLTNLTGTVAPGVEVENGASVPLRASVPGPAIELIGCGRSHRDVARFVAALQDIDGVTRVTAAESTKPETATVASSSSADSIATGDECRTRNSVPKFQIVAAFDAVPATASSGMDATPTVPATAAAPTEADGGVGTAETQQADAQGEVARAEQRAQNAANLAPGG